MLLLLSAGLAADIVIHPASPSGPSNCIPFGKPYSSPTQYQGFVYANIPAFDLYAGDTLAFDLAALNDTDINVSIAMAATTSNGSAQPDGNGFTTIATNVTAATPRGNTTKGDYELAFTLDSNFSFAGGGLIIRFQPGANSAFSTDSSCTQVLMAGNSSDSSGYLVSRFYNDPDGLYPWSGQDAYVIGGFEITYGYWYADSDGDGFGDASTSYQGTNPPSGYVRDDTDCDDTDGDTYPGAATIDSSTACMTDADGDGYGDDNPASGVTAGNDCDDSDSSVNPAASEYCDGVDNDCDGTTDEDSAVDVLTWYVDVDGDGHGDPAVTDIDCNQPSGFVSVDTDCDDNDDTVYPLATELCDGQDNDCDGAASADEEDDDSDGYVECTVDSNGWDGSTITGGEDCLDTDDTVYPGATELCDGQDNDCDGALDSTEEDLDQDGWVVCEVDANGWDGPTLSGGFEDCDDTDPDTWPGADEYCDGHDDDCDGEIDEDDSVDVITWYADGDGDGFGWAVTVDIDCDQASGWVQDKTDCDDTDPATYPGAPEVPYDTIDQDCDTYDLCDVDGDGFDYDGAECFGTDCDDEDFDINEDAEEIWYDGVDQDCDQASDYDADADGHDSKTYGGDDCDDGNPDTYPGAPDDPYDGIINDCDFADEYDQDGDGHDAEIAGGDDCDDSNSAINPGADEVWYDGIDQDCDGNDDDQDGDGWPVDEDCDDTDPTVAEDCDGGGPVDSGDTGKGQYMGGGCGGCGTPLGAPGLLLFALAAGLVRRRRA